MNQFTQIVIYHLFLPLVSVSYSSKVLMMTSHRHTQRSSFPANPSSVPKVDVMRGKIKLHPTLLKNKVPFLQHFLWASSWSVSPSPPPGAGNTWSTWSSDGPSTHMQEAGRMGDAGRGNVWMVKSPDVSFRLRSHLGKPLGSAFPLHVCNAGEEWETAQRKQTVQPVILSAVFGIQLSLWIFEIYWQRIENKSTKNVYRFV